MMEDIYTVPEAAKKLHLHPVTVYLLIEDKKLDCKRVGKKILIPESYLEKYVYKKS